MRGMFLFLILSAPAVAEQAHPFGIPEDYSEVERVEGVRIYAKGERSLPPTHRLEVKSRLRELVRSMDSVFDVEQEVFRPGEGGGMEKRFRPEKMCVLAIDDELEWAAWRSRSISESKARIWVGGSPIIPVRLAGGLMNDESWAQAWREFTHVYFRHCVTVPSGWLEVGLAEYWAYANPHAGKAASFDEMLARLKLDHESGVCVPVEALLGMSIRTFDRRATDAAWVLVHLLMVECKETLSNILKRLSHMWSLRVTEGFDYEEDLRKYTLHLLTRGLGGRHTPQEAWDHHVKALLKSPSNSKSLPGGLVPLREEPMFLEIDPKGVIRCGVRWPGVLRADGDEVRTEKGFTIRYDPVKEGNMSAQLILDEGGRYQIRSSRKKK